MSARREGSLRVVGLGINAESHLTPESRSEILGADVVLYAAGDAFTAAFLKDLRSDARDLFPFYREGRPRVETYALMTKEIVDLVKAGHRVCYAAYGHPGVFSDSAHQAIRELRSRGFDARMMPGISSDACLFADLGVDPAGGIQNYEASRFLQTLPVVNTRAALVLWQVGVIGNRGYPFAADAAALRALADHLTTLYEPPDPAIVYGAATYSLLEPIITTITVGDIAEHDHPVLSTLYVPPRAA